jgi:hypothetical protein
MRLDAAVAHAGGADASHGLFGMLLNLSSPLASNVHDTAIISMFRDTLKSVLQ